MEKQHLAEVVNLNRFRKQAKRDEASRKAEANRARYGRTREQRDEELARSERETAFMDGHQLDRGDAS